MSDLFHFPIAYSLFHQTDVQNINHIKSVMTKINNTEFFFFMIKKY